jgi:hypothetical protein
MGNSLIMFEGRRWPVDVAKESWCKATHGKRWGEARRSPRRVQRISRCWRVSTSGSFEIGSQGRLGPNGAMGGGISGNQGRIAQAQ